MNPKLLRIIFGVAAGCCIAIACFAGDISSIPKNKVIDAIIGESEGEGYVGMLAVACAIRNRGSLSGVFGANSDRVTRHLYGSKVFVNAVRAYEESAKKDITNGADSWISEEDALDMPLWVAGCKNTLNLGNHKFYKCN